MVCRSLGSERDSANDPLGVFAVSANFFCFESRRRGGSTFFLAIYYLPLRRDGRDRAGRKPHREFAISAGNERGSLGSHLFMSRLKIAVVTPELPNRAYPNRGHSVYQTLLSLSAFADLQAFCPLPRYPNLFKPRFDYRKCDLASSLPNVPTQYFEYPALPVLTRPINGYVCARFLERYTRDLQTDVILNFLLYPAGFAALSLGRKLGIPVVVGTIGSDLNAIYPTCH